jgi:26S proteasome regulatory subunit N12
MLIGLNLIHQLSMNRIADFHTELEGLSGALSNVYIKHPIQIEQCLMEGILSSDRSEAMERSEEL